MRFTIHTGQAIVYKDQRVFRSQIYKERRCNTSYLYEDVSLILPFQKTFLQTLSMPNVTKVLSYYFLLG